MPTLLADYHFECYVRRRYLFQGTLPEGEREWAYCRVIALRSAPGWALCAEVALDEGALYGPLPLAALAWKEGAPERPLADLQPWDCFGAQFTVVELSGMPPRAQCRIGAEWVPGSYVASLDWWANPWSENPSQGKRGHIWALEDGNYAVLPNNRLRVVDPSLTDVEPKSPLGYLVQDTLWSAEGG